MTKPARPRNRKPATTDSDCHRRAAAAIPDSAKKQREIGREAIFPQFVRSIRRRLEPVLVRPQRSDHARRDSGFDGGSWRLGLYLTYWPDLQRFFGPDGLLSRDAMLELRGSVPVFSMFDYATTASAS